VTLPRGLRRRGGLRGRACAPATLVVRDGRIEQCVPGAPVPEGAREVDLTGKSVVPGLIDAHAHLTLGDVRASDADLTLRAVERAMGQLRVGITTVRDVGGMRHIDLRLRDAVDEGLLPGPTLQCAGEPIVMTGGHGHEMYRVADGKAEVLKAVRDQLAAGADLIKVMCSGGVYEVGESATSSQFTDEELSAIVGEARAQGRPVAAHAHPAEAIKRAIRLGASSIEHGSFVDDEAADLMREHNVALIPTFVVYRVLSHHRSHPGLHAPARSIYQAKFPLFRRAVARGAPWGVGSDYSSMFFSGFDALLEEMEILEQEVGFSTAEVVSAVTATNAEILGLDGQVGKLEPGQWADFVAIDGPLTNVSALRDICLTVKRGHVYDWARLSADAAAAPA